MTFYHWDPTTTHYVDKLNRIVVLDGAGRGAPDPYLRELRALEGQVVRQSQRVQKMLDLCDSFQEEATGAPGNYAYNDAGTRFLDSDPRETCIRTLIECNKRAITELEGIYDKLEIEKDAWAAKSAAKYKTHFAAQARQQDASGDWQERRDRAVVKGNRDPAHVKFFWH
jgi:hypothetical protein